MSHPTKGAAPAAVAILFLVSCGNQPAQQGDTRTSETPASTQSTVPPVSSPVSINAVMVALVDHASHNLWDVEREGRAPKTDEQWRTVEEHATQLAAAGSVLMVAGTGVNDRDWVSNASWRSHAETMTKAAMDALTAARAKNLDNLVSANGRLVESCETCHKEFKPDLPSEGITHAHTH